MQDIFQSKLFKGIILGIAGLIILIFVFGLGVFVGAERADYSFKWAEAYHRNFGGPQGGIFGEYAGTDNGFANANGSFGTIIKIDGNVLTVKDNAGDNTEKSILVGTKTSIIFQRKTIKLTDLKLNENIIVIGDPDSNGQIQAELIRVMPALPAIPTTNNSLNTTPQIQGTPQTPQQNNSQPSI